MFIGDPIFMVERDEALSHKVSEALRRLRAEAACKRADQLRRLGLHPGLGITLRCPECNTAFWIRIPQVWMNDTADSYRIACVAPCGHGEPIDTFDQLSTSESAPADFDTRTRCRRCSTDYATMGVVARCPCCAIETPREVFQEVVAEIHALADSASRREPSRQDLETLLSRLVSRFDGVMRWMCSVAIRNLEIYAQYRISVRDLATASWNLRCDPDTEIPKLRRIISFQDVKKLRLSGVVGASDKQWEVMILCFAKRHLIIHKLGIVDAEYIARTGDILAKPGGLVPLTIHELLECADACKNVVVRFFGLWLG